MHQIKFWLLLSVSFLLGCSSSDSGSSSASSLQLNSSIQAPEQAQKGDLVHVKIKAFTNGGLQSVAASGDSLPGVACSAIKITGVKDETTADNVDLKLIILDYDTQVGPGKACWNGVEGANLECGESCNQMIRYATKDASQTGSIDGKITFETLSLNTKGRTSVKINTNFINDDQRKKLPLTIIPTFKLRPNAEFTIQINNTSNETLNTVYVDFSKLNLLFPEGIDYESVGDGYYDATSQRWMVPGISPGKSVTLTYKLKDVVSEELNKVSVQSALADNSAKNPILSVGAVDYQTVYPSIGVSRLPYDYVSSKKKFVLSENQFQDSIQISLPSNAISPLTFIGIDRTSLPLGLAVESSIPEGSMLNPGETMMVRINANANVQTSSGYLGIKFLGRGQTYGDTLSVNVNAMTTLT
ncbi:DUF11 domain-containing protein, partial [Facilibium subflavum]|uniref:DUF11 domain-containing protein n=1 Tax=Facilibium subflavum TaxID=2219058 RepID=UPI0013C32912